MSKYVHVAGSGLAAARSRSRESACAATASTAAPPTHVGRAIRVAYLPDPKKLGKKKGYPRPGVRDRLTEGAFQFEYVTPEFVRSGGLQKGFHVLLVPGGYAPNTADALGQLGSRRVREFLSSGGGYVGICAGAYLGTTWGLDLIPVDVLDIDHWDRGKTDDCRLLSTSVCKRVLGEAVPPSLSVRYANGPLFDVLDSSVTSLFEFDSQLCGKKGTCPPLMRGSPAAVAGRHGAGRVVLISPHIEDKPEHGEVFRNMFVWASGADVLSSGSGPPIHIAAEDQLHQLRLSQASHPSDVFEVLDMHSDGVIDRTEWGTALEALARPWPRDTVDSMFAEADANHDGCIHLAEFLKWIASDSSGAEEFRSACTSLLPFVADQGHEAEACSDGEDTELDVPALVRMRSKAEFDEPCRSHTGMDVGDSPLQPINLCRSFSVGSCCSGVTRTAPTVEVQAAVSKVQRAVRDHVLSPKGAAQQKPAAVPRAEARTRAAVEKAAKPRRVERALTQVPSDYVCWLRGPILLTAPHSLKLVRGGGADSEFTRNHKRERWTAEIAVAVARELHRSGTPAGMVIWNRTVKPERGRLDPNYLVASRFPDCPWHRSLHRWMQVAGGGGQVPLFHVDLHGKVSEKLHLDLGAAPLEEVWPPCEQNFVKTLKEALAASLNKAMQLRSTRSAKGKLLQVDADPRLHGFWGEDTVTTISHQSVLCGIPAVQFEMPPRLREQLVYDPELCALFAKTISRVYHDVVVPWWAQHVANGSSPRLAKLPAPDRMLAADVVESGPAEAAGFESWSTQVLEELKEIEQRQFEEQI